MDKLHGSNCFWRKIRTAAWKSSRRFVNVGANYAYQTNSISWVHINCLSRRSVQVGHNSKMHPINLITSCRFASQFQANWPKSDDLRDHHCASEYIKQSLLLKALDLFCYLRPFLHVSLEKQSFFGKKLRMCVWNSREIPNEQNDNKSICLGVLILLQSVAST